MTGIADDPTARFFAINQARFQSAVAKIASGTALPKASDGAAALAIATVLSGDDAVLGQAATNASQGISVAQVADGGLARISDGLIRMKELSAQALSGTNSAESLSQINSEFVQIRDEITAIAEQTTFNGKGLLDNAGSLSFAVGSAAGDNLDLDTVDATGAALGVSTLSLDSAADATAALTSIDTALDSVSGFRAEFGATASRFAARAENIATQQENLQAARSSLADADLAEQVTRLANARTQFGANVYASAQSNKASQFILRALE